MIIICSIDDAICFIFILKLWTELAWVIILILIVYKEKSGCYVYNKN